MWFINLLGMHFEYILCKNPKLSLWAKGKKKIYTNIFLNELFIAYRSIQNYALCYKYGLAKHWFIPINNNSVYIDTCNLLYLCNRRTCGGNSQHDRTPPPPAVNVIVYGCHKLLNLDRIDVHRLLDGYVWPTRFATERTPEQIRFAPRFCNVLIKK